MSWRQLPDGSYFNPATGDLQGLDGQREAAGRMTAVRQGRAPKQRLPAPPLPTQKMVVLPGTQGPEAIIDPKRDVLALNPFELGMGEMSDTKKRFLLVGGIIALAVGINWFTSRK